MTQIEMSTVQGGKTIVSPCADSLIGLGLDVSGLIIVAAGIGSGPIGWATLACIYGGLLLGGVDSMNAFKNCL